jgi:hypothetical protein
MVSLQLSTVQVKLSVQLGSGPSEQQCAWSPKIEQGFPIT